MFYLLHGDDEFGSREELQRLRQQGDFGYNQDRYQGADSDLATIIAACSTLPFLSERRLVIVEGLPRKRRGGAGGAAHEAVGLSGGEPDTSSKVSAETAESSSAAVPAAIAGEHTQEKKRARSKKNTRSTKEAAAGRPDFEQGLINFLPSMPASTTLILLLDEVLEAHHPLVAAARAYGREIKSMLPRGAALESWIAERAARLNVQITREAVSLLANLIGSQTRMLANELLKLATYVGPRGTIDVPQVRALCAQVQETRIFDLTDALAWRRRREALAILHSLLAEGQPPLLLIGFMLSQLRTLLLTRELLQQGQRPAEIAAALGIAPFIAERAVRQAKQFTLAQLEQLYRQLVATDAALKRSRLSPDVALDLLVMDFLLTPAQS